MATGFPTKLTIFGSFDQQKAELPEFLSHVPIAGVTLPMGFVPVFELGQSRSNSVKLKSHHDLVKKAGQPPECSGEFNGAIYA